MKIFVAMLILVCSCIPGMAQPVETAWLGATFQNLTQKDAARVGWKTPHGVKVTTLISGGPAEAGGLQSEDILIAMDGVEIVGEDSFSDMMEAKTPGAVVKLSIRRAELEKQIRVTLLARPFQRAPDAPELMLDIGGHMAPVVDLAVTPDGKQVVSASNDKTVRVWDIATGKTVRMIRGESAPGNWGAIYAMSLSADGRWLAIGGYLSDADRMSGSAIRLYDFASGKLMKVLKGHKNVVFSLAFSADGKRLISGSADKTARIWDVASGQLLFALKGHSAKINAVAFNKDGSRIVTGGDDETLRLWDAADGKLIAEMTEHTSIRKREDKNEENRGGRIRTAAFSSDNKMIASGSSDGRVLFWDGSTGAFLRQLANPGGMVGFAAITSLSFSPDSKWLLFASEFDGCTIYEVDSGKELRDGKLTDTGKTFFEFGKGLKCGGGIAYSPDGRLAVASYNNMIHVVNPQTAQAIKTLQNSETKIFSTGFARDGRSIAWGTDLKKEGGGLGLDPLMYSLRLPFDGAPLAGPERIATAPAAAPPPAKGIGDHPRLSTGLDASEQPAPVDDTYIRRSSEHGPWSVGFRSVDKNLIDVRFVDVLKDGALQTEINLGHNPPRAGAPMAFTPDGQSILIGRAPGIEAYDLSGRRLGGFAGHSAEVRDLTPSMDGRLLVSGGSDQTVRLWNMQTRELIVSLFHGTDGEWVVWTPQGYYASSPNGDRIVGWQINKGPDQAAEYVTASQLRNKFYRPDIVERAIQHASAAKAVEELNPAHADRFQLSDLAHRLPPKLAVLSPRDGSGTSSGRTKIELALSETPGDPVDTFQTFVNDMKVTAAAKREGSTISFEVPLAKGNNRIRLVVRSKTDLLAEAQLDVVQRGEGALDVRDTLFIVAIGADKYPRLRKNCGPSGDAQCDLAFAGADAKIFAATIEKQMGGQHKRVVKWVLVNGAGGDLEPTRANVENALDTLLQAKDNDTVAVFIAGHGLNDARTGYQFLPSDAQYADGSNLASSSVVKWTTLEGAIQSAKGRRLLFVDTCRSTNAFNPRLMKDASDDAIVAFSATNTQQDALEMPSLGHGAFTNAVVKGLNGAADIAQEQEVRVFDLGAYVEREVRKLTKGLQTPDFYKKPGAENFVLARLSNAPAALPPRDRQSTPSALKAGSRDDRSFEPSPPTVSVLPEKPAAALPPAPDVKPAGLSISLTEEAERLKRAQAALALDDIAGARLIFEYLATHGSAAGTYHLGQTFDPEILARTPMGALFRPDAKIAESWYSKAAELGHAEARKKLSAKK
jgi:WD40 repeat protein